MIINKGTDKRSKSGIVLGQIIHPILTLQEKKEENEKKLGLSALVAAAAATPGKCQK